jgi:hypothetical protein
MTEFYDNKTEEEIQAIIAQKMSLYGPDFTSLPISCNLKLETAGQQAFIVTAYAKRIGVDPGKLTLQRFVAMKNGVELYHFYNAVFSQ